MAATDWTYGVSRAGDKVDDFAAFSTTKRMFPARKTLHAPVAGLPACAATAKSAIPPHVRSDPDLRQRPGAADDAVCARRAGAARDQDHFLRDRGQGQPAGIPQARRARAF